MSIVIFCYLFVLVSTMHTFAMVSSVYLPLSLSEKEPRFNRQNPSACLGLQTGEPSGIFTVTNKGIILSIVIFFSV